MIEITWHLLLMIVVTVFLVIGMFKSGESAMDFNGYFIAVVIIILWAVYGGIVIW